MKLKRFLKVLLTASVFKVKIEPAFNKLDGPYRPAMRTATVRWYSPVTWVFVLILFVVMIPGSFMLALTLIEDKAQSVLPNTTDKQCQLGLHSFVQRYSI